jgi:hypothetical protein
MSFSGRILGTRASSRRSVTPLWSWDFTTQGNSGWQTATGGSGGTGTITWNSTYYRLTSPSTSNAIYTAIYYDFADLSNISTGVYMYIDQQKVNSGGNIQDYALSNTSPASIEFRVGPTGTTRNVVRVGPWTQASYPTLRMASLSNVSTINAGTCTVDIYRVWVINVSNAAAFESSLTLPLQTT